MSKVKRSRGWCFTLNNYTPNDMAVISSIYVTQKELQCEYLIMGFEVGRNKTPHIQGYLYFKNEKSFKQLQDLHPSWHVEKQAAKQNVHAYTYCMKDGDFIEYGKRPSQGNRSDLEVIKHDLIRGRPMTEISNEFFQQYCQYRRSFDAYLELHSKKYKTQMIQYDQNSKDSYDKLMADITSDDLWVTDVMHPPQVMQLYSSGKYRKIFQPTLNIVDWMNDYIEYII